MNKESNIDFEKLLVKSSTLEFANIPKESIEAYSEDPVLLTCAGGY